MFDKFDKIIALIKKYRALRRLKVKITKNFKDLEHRCKLTKAQKKEIQNFYISMIGRKVPLYCHEYFYSRTGVFTKDYVPNNFYHCELVPRANLQSVNRFYNDKNMLDVLFAGENIVHTVLKNINGYYYYEGSPVSEEEAIVRCQNMNQMIIKPSTSSKGNGVRLITVTNGMTNVDGLSIGQLFAKYQKDFLIQHRVRQHKDMAALNPTSVNTLRILSYRSNMEVLIIYTVIRIGRQNSVIDNQCAGGISTTVSEKGELGKTAFGGYHEDNIEKTDSGVVLEGYTIPSYDKAMAMIKHLHMKLPFCDLIGWDIAIQEDGNPVLIEINTNPGLSQSAFKSGMGKYTERVIRELWPKPNTRYHC